MQNAKDTFYTVLRDRVAAANAGMTVEVRGVVRAAVVVEENELVTDTELRDGFLLRWTGLQVDADGLAKMGCEIRYSTAGMAGGGGLDRGRVMASMDAALATAVGMAPQNAVKRDFARLASGGAVRDLGSRIWWGDVSFGALTDDGGELRRAATVEVWSYREAGE